MSRVEWSYYNKFDEINDKYLPMSGEGENLATQVVTAVNKLIYKWYNDVDVFDNVHSGLAGWANDLSSYANWLYNNCNVKHILKQIDNCFYGDDYEQLLKELADTLLNETVLETLNTQEKQGSIYDCDGPFEFSDYEDEDEEDIW